MNDNETIRWPTSLDRAAIEGRLVQVRNAARGESLAELVALLDGVETKPAAQLASAVIGALGWLDGTGHEARARIERAEHWLLERERDPELLATLGRLCAQAELWGKAKSFLEASLSFEPTRTAHLELARLSERLGENEDAQRHYRRAAELN